jgi:DNA-binding transcriptional LysR family regulator
MNRVDDLDTFIAIVESGSLTAAARRMGRPVQSVSRALSTLEGSVGVELIRRTTRHLSPTEAGAEFFRRVQPAVAEINEARLEAGSKKIEASGLLRVGAPTFFAPPYIVPAAAAFMARYPKIELELRLSGRFADLVEERLDLAIRIGELRDTDLKAKRLGELRRTFFASPAYLARHGRPEHPTDLPRQQCLVRSEGAPNVRWPYTDNGETKEVQVTGRFRSDNSASIMRAAALAGIGIGFGPLWQIHEFIDSGELELILVDFEPPPVPIHAVWQGGRLMPAKTRLFIDLVAEHLRTAKL